MRLDNEALVAGSGAYELAVDCRERVVLNESHLQTMRKALTHIAQSSANASVELYGKRPYMIAVDAMFSGSTLELFEVHIPGRSLGIHLLPLLWVMDPPRDCLMALDSFQRDLLTMPFAADHLPSLSVPQTEFHLMDAMCLEWMFRRARVSQSVNGSPVAPVFDLSPDDVRPGRLSEAQARVFFDRSFWRRQLDYVGDFPRRWATIPRHSRDLSEIEAYGPWVVLKANTNYPWWHEDRVADLGVSATEFRTLCEAVGGQGKIQ